MKLYSYYTPSHERLVKDWFVPSVQDDYEIVLREGMQKSVHGDYKSGGWNETMLGKITLCIDAVKDNWGKTFIYSDPDIQFFGRTRPSITRLILLRDLVIQRDEPRGDLCAGFWACRGNTRTLKLWEDVYAHTKAHPEKDDQDALNAILCPDPTLKTTWLGQLGANAYHVRWCYLPDTFMGGGLFTGQLWEPGKTLNIPSNIVMHHANFAQGVPHKIAQLHYVKRVVEGRKSG